MSEEEIELGSGVKDPIKSDLENAAKKNEDEIKLDFSKIKTIWANKKTSSIILMLVLLLIPIFLAVQFRTYPLSLPVAETWARDGVYNNVKNQIRDQII